MDRFEAQDDVRKKWIDAFVTVNENRPELKRFSGVVGRVVTVNYNGRAIVDFQDGAWYDIPASDEHLVRVEAPEESAKYKNVNSAQVIPDKQG
jgi:DNA-binding Lrp family transcriptional regulator